MRTRNGAIVLAAALVLVVAAGSVHAANQAEIDQAIQKGLAHLASQQDPYYGLIGDWNYPLASTAAAVLAFENEGHFPGGGNTYSTTVERGLDFIFRYLVYKRPISIQTYGYPGRNDNPDTNGNGLGIYFGYNSALYETGLVMQALVASNTPDRVVEAGQCAGMTYRAVLQDVVDFLAWAQIDGGYGRGGWRYGAYDNSSDWGDNSVAQWPVLGLVAAAQWGIHAPQFVKNEMEYWVTFIQNANGGSGYNEPGTWTNVSKTGGLLVEFYYLGDTSSSARVQKALSFLNSHWGEAINSYNAPWDGNLGHPYAMFSVFKGLELMKVTAIPNAASTPDSLAGDWWGQYCHYLVQTQNPISPTQGYWVGYQYWGWSLATPWYIVILQASVFPVSVDVVVPGASCDVIGYDVSVHYGVERFNANGTLSIYRDGVLFETVTLTDFIGSSIWTRNVAPETAGGHTWKAVLEVTGGGITTSAEDSGGGTVYETPAVAGIPDQVTPFVSFDLDAYQTCACDEVAWTVSGAPDGWTVTIDSDHVATVVPPDGAWEPASLNFIATFRWDGVDCSASDTAVFSPNHPPEANAGKVYPEESYEVLEGSSVTLDGSASSDPDGDAITSFAWDLDGDGTFEAAGSAVTFSAALRDGPSHVYVHIQVCDEHGACGIATARVNIVNVAPTITSVVAPTLPVDINTQPVQVGVTFTDPGVPDTHTVTVDWDDLTVETLPAVSPVTLNHTYAAPGVYTVTITVADDDGGAATWTHEYIVVYDPSAGFVTGGGWITSPAGAYLADPSLTGRANFGFVSKYKKGATAPTGTTEFLFHAAGMNFHSAAYQWLVVAGAKAMYKGTGTINGTGSYGFMLSAIDGVLPGGGGMDKFRIRIWDSATEAVVYDNQVGSADDADPTTAIGGGSIVIHTGK